MKFALAFLLIVPTFVTASPAATYSMLTVTDRDNPDSGTALLPKRHPDDDPTDPALLKATQSHTLYYEAPSGYGLVHIPAFNHPAVALDRTDFVSSVNCNAAGNLLTVGFTDDKSWGTAYADWNDHSPFFIITHVGGCGSGVAEGARDFHLVSSIRSLRSKRQIVCTISTVDVEQAAHPDHVISFRINTHGAASRAKVLTRSNGYPGNGLERLSKRVSIDEIWGGITTGWETVKTKAVEFTVNVVNIVKANPASLLSPLTILKDALFPSSGAFGFLSSTSEWVKTPFNDAYGYQLVDPANSASKTGNYKNVQFTIAGKVGIWCVECGVKSNNIGIDAAGTMTSTKSLLSGTITGGGDLEAVVALGVEAEAEVEVKSELPPLTIPIPTPITIYIPGFVKIGPTVDLTFGFSLKAGIKGRIYVGATCKWSNIAFVVDVLNPSASSITTDSWIPVCTSKDPISTVTGTATAGPYMKLGLNFGLEALPALTKALTLAAELAVQFSLDFAAAVSSADDCGVKAGDVKFSVEGNVVVYVEGKISILFDPKKDLWKLDPPLKIYNNCKTKRAVLQLDSGLETRQGSDDDAPPSDDTPPPADDTPPPSDDTAPSDSDGSATSTDGTSPPADSDGTMDGTTPDDDTSSPGDQSPPSTDGTSPPADSDGTMDGTAPDDDTSSPGNQSPPSTDGTEPPSDGTPPPADSSTEAADTGSSDEPEHSGDTTPDDGTPVSILWPDMNLTLSIGGGGELSFTEAGSALFLLVDGLIFLSSEENQRIMYADDELASNGVGSAYMTDGSGGELYPERMLAFVMEDEILVVVNLNVTKAYLPIACSSEGQLGLFMGTDESSVDQLKAAQAAEDCVICALSPSASA
ncbi:hypothetical protein DFH07DRAFT_509808 [Mycena maculata]|uniref:Uncharacterized protein n=1 Tax=Mycena maculata TaxID=230809 RepID=A0AAD7IZ40_9AGAR|nr:hypothetical protein DFH07DRAFT_509808 [Mycena maculata]